MFDKKILIVFGTRPEAIKMAPLVNVMLNQKNIKVKICVTAQHREMLDQVLDFFKIVPDYDLDLMKKNQSLNELSSRIIKEIDKVLIDFEPNLVLVHGDTTTSSMVALASFHRQIKIGHIEAGLRTYNKTSPFPEEVNRQITGRLADYHFAPTFETANNLIKKENVNPESVFVTGNTVIDALLWGIDNIDINRTEIKNIQSKIDSSKKLILVTGHRRENFGKKFESFCNALVELAKRNDVQLIYPVHLNPNIKETAFSILDKVDNILLIDPLDYEVFIWLMNSSYFIISDSGGIQEEAPSLNKKVLVTREVTERQEAVDAGCVKLVGTDKKNIIENSVKLLEDDNYFDKMFSLTNPYGDGNASEKIKEIILSLL